jgi:hypothetical protein
LNIKSEALAEKDNKMESLSSELEARKLQNGLKDDTIKTLNEDLKLSQAKFDDLTKQHADLNQSLARCQEMVDQNTLVNQSQIEKNRLADDEIKQLKAELADKEAECA